MLNKSTDTRLWTGYYILILFIITLIQMINNMLNTTMAEYVKQIGGSNFLGGFSMTVFTITALLTRPISGKLADSRSRKIILIIGSSVVVLASLLYNFSFVVITLLAVRAIHGVGFSGSTTVTSTVVSDIVPNSRLNEGIGYFGIATTIAMAIGPAVAMFIIARYNYRYLFVIITVLSVIAFVPTFMVNYEKKAARLKTETPVIPANLKGGFIERAAIPGALVTVLYALTFTSVSTFLYLYATTRGIKNIGIYFTINACAIILIRVTTSRLGDRLGPKKMIIPGMALLFISMIILAFANTLPLFLISSVLNGFGNGIIQPILLTTIIRMCPAHKRGAANAMYWAALDIGVGIGSMIWGFISQLFGYTVLYIATAACVVLSFLIYVYVVDKRSAAPNLETSPSL